MGPLLAIAGPILGSVAGAAASSLFAPKATNLTGANSNTLSNISAGGLTSSISGSGDKRTVNLRSNPLRESIVGNLAKTFPQQAALLHQLRLSVAPGVSGLRAARLRAIENARSMTLSDLRENLGRRRILGSSFAQDALTRADIGFADQKDAVEADSFLKELELTSQLSQAEFETSRGEFQTQLDELNLQAQTAAELAGAATQQMGANARLQAELDAKNAAGMGAFFQPAIDAISTGVSNLLKPTSSSDSWSSAFFTA